MNDQSDSVYTVHESVDGFPVMWRTVFSSLTDAKLTIEATRSERADEDEIVEPLNWNEDAGHQHFAYENTDQDEPRWVITQATLAVSKEDTVELEVQIAKCFTRTIHVPKSLVHNEDFLLDEFSDWESGLPGEWVSTHVINPKTGEEIKEW